MVKAECGLFSCISPFLHPVFSVWLEDGRMKGRGRQRIKEQWTPGHTRVLWMVMAPVLAVVFMVAEFTLNTPWAGIFAGSVILAFTFLVVGFVSACWILFSGPSWGIRSLAFSFMIADAAMFPIAMFFLVRSG